MVYIEPPDMYIELIPEFAIMELAIVTLEFLEAIPYPPKLRIIQLLTVMFWDKESVHRSIAFLPLLISTYSSTLLPFEMNSKPFHWLLIESYGVLVNILSVLSPRIMMNLSAEPMADRVPLISR